ncbi:PTS sugar transporter subunit IIB [Oenococcus oeni]|uniref:PTS sugar transporter subunit IIB n=2 Tax=Oenococcus oeni TaxID=1247 RepID=UPI0008F87488|nr:PTS sugar transporter subunit IIB [Oenococcus oeni]OIK85871.1 PTS sugar transporter subunit IIB [Oenococcus oeni]OIL08269.1 PTS sugar transporter subunit IIB [Oenococcus oeni]OIL11326.1 PTS sugar transporter subunit IIB [Oenococcus oeni]
MSKKTIMVVCAGGMSSSLLENKMNQAAKKKNLDYKIFATAGNAVEDEIKKENPDVILLGPQVRYMQNTIQQKTSVPVEIIDMKDYGTMNGTNVLETALKIIN